MTDDPITKTPTTRQTASVGPLSPSASYNPITPPPWMAPAPLSVESVELARRLVAGKGIAYDKQLTAWMEDLEGRSAA